MRVVLWRLVECLWEGFFSAWGRRLFTITECINLNFISTDSLESLILGGVRKCKKAQRGDGKKLLLLFEFSTLLFHTELSFGFNMLQHVSGQIGVCVRLRAAFSAV